MIASDGTGYTTYALMLAAGKVPWPNMDEGGYLEEIYAEDVTDLTQTFYIGWNTLTAPTTDQMILVPANTGPFKLPYGVGARNIWIKKTANDHLVLTGLY